MDGILLINKSAGMTSHDVVYQARKHLHQKAIGHTGTLDPFATGLLVLLVGRTTKLEKYFAQADKVYQAEVLLGTKTDTDDITGSILSQSDCGHLKDETIIQTLESFKGEICQLPARYSAIKINGKKMYEYARKDLEMPTVDFRKVTIYQIKDIQIHSRDSQQVKISFVCSVSKGTYIRSLARDLGELLGVGATLSGLNRIQVGHFHLSQAQTINEINPDTPLLDPLPYLGMQRIVLDGAWIQKVEVGSFLPLSLFPEPKETILLDNNHHPVAIYRYDLEKNVMRMSVKLS